MGRSIPKVPLVLLFVYVCSIERTVLKLFHPVNTVRELKYSKDSFGSCTRLALAGSEDG